MTRFLLWGLGASAVAALAWLLSPASPGDATPAAPGDGSAPAPAPSLQPIHYRSRADGVDQRLQDFLDACQRRLSFPLSVARDGGVRTDAARQLTFYQTGKSKAATLAETPHGRAGALDVAPYTFDAVADSDPRWQEIGDVAHSLGLVWGGDWSDFRDAAHVEVADWRSLPFPPNAPAGVA